jgi:hypothetical protein
MINYILKKILTWRYFFLILILTMLLTENIFSYVNSQENMTQQDNIKDLISALIEHNSEAFVLSDDVIFEIKDFKNATKTVKYAVTILNLKGRKYGRTAISYDCYRKIDYLKGRMLDLNGKEIRKLKKSDIHDYSAIADFSVYEDNRVRLAELYSDQYPYTVCFEYRIKYKGLISYPTWYPQKNALPVQNTNFQIIAPKNMEVSYRVFGNIAEPIRKENAKTKSWLWEKSNLPKREREPYEPSFQEQMPYLLVAPTQFEIGGYSGDMSSWESFGVWYFELIKDRDTLPGQLKNKINNLCQNTDNEKKKIRILYQFLQETTRYISIQLGIGSWQPFDATFVYENGYGDCKALTNYMQAMLRAVNITSHPALITNGLSEPEANQDFPCNRFNHVILFVPLKKDTLWLECSSQVSAFGQIHAGIENRYALVVTPNGGELMRTPSSNCTQNQQICRTDVTLQSTGDATADVEIVYTGNQQNYIRSAFIYATDMERKKWLQEYIEIPSFELKGFDFTTSDSNNSNITLCFSMEIKNCTAKTSKRLFLNPNLLHKRKTIPEHVQNRKQPVDLSYTYLDVDSICYKLPDNFQVEAEYQPTSIKKYFASYSTSATVNNGRINYVRRLEMRVNHLPAEQYDEFRDFILQVVKADKKQVVLVKH